MNIDAVKDAQLRIDRALHEYDVEERQIDDQVRILLKRKNEIQKNRKELIDQVVING